MDDLEVSIGASVGIATTTPGRLDADELLDAADRALYRAKGDGPGSLAPGVGPGLSLDRPVRRLVVRVTIGVRSDRDRSCDARLRTARPTPGRARPGRDRPGRVPGPSVRPGAGLGPLPGGLRWPRGGPQPPARGRPATAGGAGAEPRGPRTSSGSPWPGPPWSPTPTSRRRSQLLRPMFTGEDAWCQLFSEPGAGSDLAGLAARAVRDGDEWVITGQKVWNTLAHLADRGMLVARTDPGGAQAQGHDLLRPRHARTRVWRCGPCAR